MVKRKYKTRYRFLIIGTFVFLIFVAMSVFTLSSISRVNRDIGLITKHEIPLTKVFDNIIDLLLKNSRNVSLLSREMSQSGELESGRSFALSKIKKDIEANIEKIKIELAKGKQIINSQSFNDEQRRYAYLSLITLEDSVRDINITTSQLLRRIEKGDKSNTDELIEDLFNLNNNLNDNLIYFSDEIDSIITTSSASLENDIGRILGYNYFIVIFFILTGLTFFAYVYRFLLYPLDEAIEGIEAISRGDRSFTFKKSWNRTGLGHLIVKLRTMLDSVNDFEQKLKNEKERALESEKLKSQFLSSMSHEIRTPLNTIIGTTEILEESDLPDHHRKLIGSISNASNNLLDIINKVLDISKIEAGQFELHEEIFEPRVLIEDVIGMFKYRADKKEISLLLSIDENVPRYVEGSAVHIRQILINLLSNSLKFTEKGYVKISMERESGERYIFSVKDTGIGIAKNYLSKLFTPFSQQDSSIFANFGGTGLGLSFCQKVLKLMDSQMEVDSKVDEGTTFKFIIHLRNIVQIKQTYKDKIDYVEQINQSKGLRILVVDDAEDNINLLKLYFAKLNIEVDFCLNGREAVDAYSKNPYDIVIMDVQMPIMNGNDAIIHIRQFERDNRIPYSYIISLTAHAISAEREKCFAAGCNEYLAKPIKKNMLFEKIYEGIAREAQGPSMKMH